jgi:hypothetical protein
LKPAQGRAPRQPLFASEPALDEASRSFKSVQLMLLMHEWEDAVVKLVEIQESIWLLEEFFRSDGRFQARRRP